MSNLEHLIENTLVLMERNKDLEYKKIIQYIQSDVNYDGAGITAEQCYEICQYVLYVYFEEMRSELDKCLRLVDIIPDEIICPLPPLHFID